MGKKEQVIVHTTYVNGKREGIAYFFFVIFLLKFILFKQILTTSLDPIRTKKQSSKLTRVNLHRIALLSNKRCPNNREFEQNL